MRKSGKEGSRRSKRRLSMMETEIKNRRGIGGDGEGERERNGRRSKRRCSRKGWRMIEMKTIKRSKRILSMKEKREKKRKNIKRGRTAIKKRRRGGAGGDQV